MSQVTVFSGAQRRRRWSVEQKRAVVEAAFAPGASVAEIARRADLAPGQIYRWRKELGTEPVCSGFAGVTVRPEPDLSGAAMIVELGGTVVRIGAGAPPALVAAVLGSLAR